MSQLFRITLIAGLILGTPVLLVMVVFFAVMSPMGVLVGLALGALYVAVSILLLRLLPQWPRQVNWWWIPAALMWGGAVGFLAANVAGGAWFDLAYLMKWEESAASWGGAYPEEIGKALGVVIILMVFRGLNRPWHGFTVGAMVGLGFEVFENLLYGVSFGMMDPSSDAEGAVRMWGLRIATGPLMHGAWTALAGWGVGLALFTAEKSRTWRVGQAVGWLLLAFALHWVWNYTLEDMVAFTIKAVITLAITYGGCIWILVRTWSEATATSGYSTTTGVVTSVEQLVSARVPGEVRDGAKHRALR